MENELLEETGYVGDIPEGWKWVKVEDFAEVVSGGTPSTDKPEFWNGDIAWITPKDLSDFKFRYIDRGERNISREGLENSNAKLLPRGTVLLSSRAPVGYLAIAKNELSTNQGFQNLIPKENVISEFLYYLLKNNVEYLKSQASGTTFGELSKSTLKKLIFLLPPLPEQKAIAEVLSSIDDKIELLHRQNKTLGEMAMTLFRQWFIEPTKDGLPEGWEEVSLGEIIEISSGKSIEKGKLKEKGLYPVLGANGEIGRVDDWLYEGELIYTGRVGTLGNVFIVFKNEKVWLTDNTLVIRPKKNEYYYFVYFTLKNAKLDEYNSGSTQPLIRQSDIKKMEIFLPKINFLKDFELISRNIFTKIQFNTFQIQTLEKLRDTLLPKLMSGEVRVKF